VAVQDIGLVSKGDPPRIEANRKRLLMLLKKLAIAVDLGLPLSGNPLRITLETAYFRNLLETRLGSLKQFGAVLQAQGAKPF
jgi:hypothetical protein